MDRQNRVRTSEEFARYKNLADRERRGERLTDEERKELNSLDRLPSAKVRTAPRSIYDLPIFRWAWEGDAQDKERA